MAAVQSSQVVHLRRNAYRRCVTCAWGRMRLLRRRLGTACKCTTYPTVAVACPPRTSLTTRQSFYLHVVHTRCSGTHGVAAPMASRCGRVLKSGMTIMASRSVPARRQGPVLASLSENGQALLWCGIAMLETVHS